MHPEIETRLPEIAAVCRRHRVSRLEVFGSAARGADFDPAASDADFTVVYLPGSRVSALGHIRLADALADALGRKVDLVEPVAVRNRYALEEIERDRELVYEA